MDILNTQYLLAPTTAHSQRNHIYTHTGFPIHRNHTLTKLGWAVATASVCNWRTFRFDSAVPPQQEESECLWTPTHSPKPSEWTPPHSPTAILSGRQWKRNCSDRATSKISPNGSENRMVLHKRHLFRHHSPLKYIWHIITEGEAYVEYIEPDPACLRKQNTRHLSTTAATLWCSASYFKDFQQSSALPLYSTGWKVGVPGTQRGLSSPLHCHIIGKLLNWYLRWLAGQVCWLLLDQSLQQGQCVCDLGASWYHKQAPLHDWETSVRRLRYVKLRYGSSPSTSVMPCTLLLGWACRQTLLFFCRFLAATEKASQCNHRQTQIVLEWCKHFFFFLRSLAGIFCKQKYCVLCFL